MSKPLESDSVMRLEPAERASWKKRALVWVMGLWDNMRQHLSVDWLVVLVILGIVWWYGEHYSGAAYFRFWLSAGLQIVAEPSRLADVLLGIGIAVVLALWWLPKWQAAGSPGISAENRFDRENETRKTLAQIVAGAFVLAGLYSSVRTFNLQRDTENLQREGQITDRHTKAIEQLGALAPGSGVDAEGRPKINLEVRLGGIYALERIAKDSPKDHWTIVEVLTAYVRQNAPLKLTKSGAKPRQQVEPNKLPTVREDIQAILTVIGRRDTQHDPPGSRLDFTEAVLNRANLNEAHLGRANLNGANLFNADLVNADLSRASLSGADLRAANLLFAHLIRANLLYADLIGADLRHADLSQADLRMANLSKVINLTQSQLDQAYGDAGTQLPLGLARPASWRK